MAVLYCTVFVVTTTNNDDDDKRTMIPDDVDVVDRLGGGMFKCRLINNVCFSSFVFYQVDSHFFLWCL